MHPQASDVRRCHSPELLKRHIQQEHDPYLEITLLATSTSGLELQMQKVRGEGPLSSQIP